jgi:hypothetical protein
MTRQQIDEESSCFAPSFEVEEEEGDSMRQTKVVSDPIERPKLLKQLGLTEGVLQLAATKGYSAWANLTMNHPALYRGVVPWGETMAAFCDSLIPLGWKRGEHGGQPFIMNTSLNFAITIATGDENTGLKEREPSTKSSKGTRTKFAVTNNALAHTLFGDIRSENRKSLETRITWILLFRLHQDETTSEIRCELSLPLKMNKEGQIDQWLTRIILSSTPFGASTINVSSEPRQTPNIEIDVTRRRA